MLINNNYFTDIGRDFKAGMYNNLLKGTYEYQELWDEIIYRCYNGYTVGGKYITGRLWSYCNFGTILLLGDYESGTGKKDGVPLLRDVDWEMDYYLHKAREEKKGLFIVGGRRLGKTNMVSWHETVYPAVFLKQWVGVGTQNDDKMSDYLAQVFRHLNGLKGTELSSPLLKRSLDADIEFGYAEKIEGEWNDIKTGGKISHRLFKDNPMAFNGTSLYSAVFEETGIFKNLKEAITASRPCWTEGTMSFGIPVGLGTGGSMDGDSNASCEIFQNPEAYGFLSFRDPDNDKKKIGYFVDGYKSLNDLRDEFGVVDKVKGIEHILKEREIAAQSSDFTPLIQFTQYYPIKWQDAYLKSSGQLFKDATLLLQNQINYIDSEDIDSSMRRGHFETEPLSEKIVIKDGKGKFVESVYDKDVAYPHDAGSSKCGCITIYERPFYLGGVVPDNLYIAGYDPYREDNSETSGSLASVFIYKRFSNFGVSGDILVAEYTGRPLTSDAFHEQLIGLLLMYNAKVLYENEVVGVMKYFLNRGFIRLLARQPAHLKDIIANSTVDRGYGVHMPIQVKLHVVKLIKSYLVRKITETTYKTSEIYFINLLRELKDASLTENFDRFIAFGLVLLYEESLITFDTKAAQTDTKQSLASFYNDLQKDVVSNNFSNPANHFKLTSLLS